uniref:Uncharacterized protein n=1 Tax=Glossina austeni TaxID=7395 RepID=A0A1A9VSU3_GLOAU
MKLRATGFHITDVSLRPQATCINMCLLFTRSQQSYVMKSNADCKFIGSKFNIGLSSSNPSECKLMRDISLSIFFKVTWPGFEAISLSNLLLCCLCNFGAEIGYESDYICKIFKILLHGNIDGCLLPSFWHKREILHSTSRKIPVPSTPKIVKIQGNIATLYSSLNNVDSSFRANWLPTLCYYSQRDEAIQRSEQQYPLASDVHAYLKLKLKLFGVFEPYHVCSCILVSIVRIIKKCSDNQSK